MRTDSTSYTPDGDAAETRRRAVFGRLRPPVARSAAMAAGAAISAAGALWFLDPFAAARGAGLCAAIFGAWVVPASLAIRSRAGAPTAACALLAGVAGVGACQTLSGSSPTGFALVYAFLAVVAAVTTACLIVAERRRADADAAVGRAGGLALLDVATGSGTRASFEQRAASELARARRHDLPFAIARIDVAGLGRVSDDCGVELAEEVLRGIAIGVSASLRGEDYLARFDGGRFAVLLAGSGAEGARRVVRRIVAGVDGLGELDERLAGITAFAGAAVYPDDGQSLDALLGVADAGAQIGTRSD